MELPFSLVQLDIVVIVVAGIVFCLYVFISLCNRLK